MNCHRSQASLIIGTTLLMTLLIPTLNALNGNSSPNSHALAKIKNVKGVLFDIDGTLANSWRLGFDATLAVLEKNDIKPITEHTYHQCTRYATPHRLALHAGLDETSQNFKDVGDRLGAEFDELYVDLVDTQTAGFYEGIHDVLDEFPGDVKVGALTNACVAYAVAVLKTNRNVINRFISVHGADDVPAAKPKGDGLILCCKEMGLEPSECVYIGDSPSDGFAAEDAGMPCLGVLWGSHKEETLVNAPFLHLCNSVEELHAYLPRQS